MSRQLPAPLSGVAEKPRYIANLRAASSEMNGERLTGMSYETGDRGSRQEPNGSRQLDVSIRGAERNSCFLRRRRRGAQHPALWRNELKTSEDIALAKEREDLRSARAKRKRREARARFELVERSVLLGLTVASTVVIWILLFRNPHAIPLAVGGFGAGGGLAVGYGRWRAKRADGRELRG